MVFVGRTLVQIIVLMWRISRTNSWIISSCARVSAYFWCDSLWSIHYLHIFVSQSPSFLWECIPGFHVFTVSHWIPWSILFFHPKTVVFNRLCSLYHLGVCGSITLVCLVKSLPQSSLRLPLVVFVSFLVSLSEVLTIFYESTCGEFHLSSQIKTSSDSLHRSIIWLLFVISVEDPWFLCLLFHWFFIRWFFIYF